MPVSISKTPKKDAAQVVHDAAGLAIELNDEFQTALKLMNDTSDHVFLTGRAGTGKSTLLKHFRATTKKKIVVLAPTGVAAVNVKGQTIHSFFRFGINVTPDTVRKQFVGNNEIYKNLDTIVIDEISMVRADLLDCVDAFMRRNGPHKNLPFGGVQIVAVGDPYQLPPVVPRDEEQLFRTYYESPYFFDSKSFSEADFKLVELTKIYRQAEADFIGILEAVRIGALQDSHLQMINARHDEDFVSQDAPHIHLVTTNAMADAMNTSKLGDLDTESFTLTGNKTGKFDKNLPTNEVLYLKEGARVMLLTNEPMGKWVNGDLGEVVEVNDLDSEVLVKLEDGTVQTIEPYQWEMVNFMFNKEKNVIESDTVGTFTQFPLKLAWAVTIHKGQGKTYEKVVVDFGRGTFAHGQAYVALSRCTSLDGLVLRMPLEKNHVRVDQRVVTFMHEYRAGKRGKPSLF